MMSTIARTGSFAAAARELGKVPSALTYSVRQLEETLDVLLFDRRSRQAQLTPAGQELISEGQRVLQELDAIANRVRRIATGWESELTIAVNYSIAPQAIFDLIESFYAQRIPGNEGISSAPPTRIRIRNEMLTGTWEALLTGQADLSIGVHALTGQEGGTQLHCEELGSLELIFCVAPQHPLAKAPEPLTAELIAQHRIITIADSAREMLPTTIGVFPGQDVLTMPSIAAKLEAQLRGLGCGALPATLVKEHLRSGRLVHKQVVGPARIVELHYAWHSNQFNGGAKGAGGHALNWWLAQLRSPVSRKALLEPHADMLF